MLSFRRVNAAYGESHVADLNGPDGAKYVLHVHKLPYRRKWTVTLVGPDHVVPFTNRFSAETPTRAVETAVNLVRSHLETQAALAAAILPQIAVPANDEK